MATTQQAKHEEDHNTALANATQAAVTAVEKARTQADKARDKADAEFRALEASTLEGAETFVVVHPSVNLYVGDELPVREFKVGTETVFLDVVDGFVKVPRNTQLIASSGEELADFRLKASLGFFSAVPAAL